MKLIKKIKIFVFTAQIIIISHVNAQSAPSGFNGNALLAVGSNSNVFGLSSNKQSDSLLIVSPEFQFVENYGKHSFLAKYEGDYARFKEFNSLDYTDHSANIQANFEHSTRFKTEFGVRYQKVVELPGLNDSITQSLLEFNKTNKLEFNSKGTYGRDDATGQAVFQFNRSETKYTNNEQEFRDYALDKIVGTFFYRVAPNTRVVVETSLSKSDYKSDRFNPSSQYTNLLLGAEWRPTAKTKGIIKIGSQRQDFDNDSFEDIAGLAYFADIFWKPNTYSLIQIGASRSTRESSEESIGGFVATEFTLKAKHEFIATLTGEVTYRYGEDDLVFSENITLKRHQFELNLLNHSLKWADIQFSVKYFNRNSNRFLYDFDSAQLTLGLIGHFSKRSI